MTVETVLTITLAIACIALGVGIGTFIGLLLHIKYSSDYSIEAYGISSAQCEIEKIRMSNEITSLIDRNYDINKKNIALKIRIKELEESLRTTLDHNAYLSKEAMRLNERNIELNSRQKEALKYLKDGLASRISSFENSNLALEIGACGAYRRVRDEIEYLEKKYESEDKK